MRRGKETQVLGRREWVKDHWPVDENRPSTLTCGTREGSMMESPLPGRMSGPHYLRGEPAGWSTEIYVTLLGEIDVYSVRAVDVGRSDWIWAIW